MQLEKVKKAYVVPRKGDVDRNIVSVFRIRVPSTSSPARGTWIEISFSGILAPPFWSSPARGTWIEILLSSRWALSAFVVPRKGDVDRNLDVLASKLVVVGRPPQGGRG